MQFTDARVVGVSSLAMRGCQREGRSAKSRPSRVAVPSNRHAIVHGVDAVTVSRVCSQREGRRPGRLRLPCRSNTRCASRRTSLLRRAAVIRLRASA